MQQLIRDRLLGDSLAVVRAPVTAKDRFEAPPPPGVHPRVYFNPEDVPVIRERLQNSRIARARWELIRGRVLQISPNRELVLGQRPSFAADRVPQFPENSIPT